MLFCFIFCLFFCFVDCGCCSVSKSRLTAIPWNSQVALVVKEPSCQCRRLVRDADFTLGGEDSQEEGIATHSRTLAWRIPWAEEPGGLQSMGLQIVGHDRNDSAHMNCSMQGFPILQSLPESAQTKVHWVGDATQPSHRLLSPSPLDFSLPQHVSP